MTETESPTDDTPPNEAARWRRKLRDAEAERDRLAAQLADAQQRHAEHLAASIPAAALWATTELADLLDNDGNLDPQRVAEASQAAIHRLGVTPGLYVPAEGTIPSPARTGGFTAAFTPGRTR